MESAIKHRGRARVLQKIRQAGIDGDIAEDAVREVFEDVDEDALLDRALRTPPARQDADETSTTRAARASSAACRQGFGSTRSSNCASASVTSSTSVIPQVGRSRQHLQ